MKRRLHGRLVSLLRRFLRVSDGHERMNRVQLDMLRTQRALARADRAIRALDAAAQIQRR